MSNRISLVLMSLALILTACQPAFRSGLESPGPAEEPFATAILPAAAEPAFGEGEADAFGRAADPAGAPAADRLVIKDVNLSIVVDDPAESMNAIAQLAERMGGFVVSSNLFRTQLESGQEVPRASITVRVPAERLQEALSQIESGATRVLSKNESGQDVTQEYTDLQSRLRNLEDAEEQLRQIMDAATRIEDVLAVYNQLTRVREEIEVIRGRIQYLEQSAAFSAISVELIANAAVQPLTIGGWQPAGVAREALQSLINTLQVLASAAIWLALYLLPVAVVIVVPLALAWRGFKAWRAGRRAAKAPPVPKTPEG